MPVNNRDILDKTFRKQNYAYQDEILPFVFALCLYLQNNINQIRGILSGDEEGGATGAGSQRCLEGC